MASIQARCVISIRRTSGCSMIGLCSPAGAPTARPWRRSIACASACWYARSATASPCSPTDSRAVFIIVNMFRMPSRSSPINHPIAPSRSPNDSTHVGLPWIPNLCSIDTHVTSLRSPSEPSAADEVLGHEEHRDPLGARRRAGRAGQHQVHDVVGEVVLAVRDEDLLAADAPRAVASRFGLGCARRRRRYRLAAR